MQVLLEDVMDTVALGHKDGVAFLALKGLETFVAGTQASAAVCTHVHAQCAVVL